ncbi:hypothetical protein HAX54_000787, partial [Datura stramonium]|nr:hypothetical protein [Datura stramonium]
PIVGCWHLYLCVLLADYALYDFVNCIMPEGSGITCKAMMVSGMVTCVIMDAYKAMRVFEKAII